jgi:cytochrome c-type biogenesis protein
MQGGTLLFAYGVGMTAPFILAAVFVGPFQRFSSRFRRWLPMVEKVMGLMLIAFAVLLASNGMNRIADWMIQTFPFFQTIG